MNFLKLFFTISFCVVLIANTTAQKKSTKVKDDKCVASDTYSNFEYKRSAQLFHKKENTSFNDMAKLADSYRLNSDTENAEFWYEQIVDITDKPENILHYAQMLQSNGKYNLAKEYYLKYDEVMGEDDPDARGRIFAEAIDQMDEFKNTKVKIQNESFINSDKLDFSPAYFNDGIIFVSSRKMNDGNKKERDYWTDDFFTSLFFSPFSKEGDLRNIERFSIDLTTQYHEGPVTISKDGSRIFYTASNYVENKKRYSKDGAMKLNIFGSVKEGNKWSTPFELSFSTEEYEEVHPALSPDGKKLYFSSDRPGGYGGMDIYVSEFKKGRWMTPENLGEQINTPGSEVFPWIHDDGTLYFASNGWGGLGGLDIFLSKMTEDDIWSKADNLGTPFNSPKDDFGFILNKEKSSGFLTSAREEGLGKDDIYSFEIPTNLTTAVTVCAIDEFNNTKLADVEFEVIEQYRDGAMASLNSNIFVENKKRILLEKKYTSKLKEMGVDVDRTSAYNLFNTDRKGKFETAFEEDKEYILIASKDGYEIGKERVNGSVLKGKETHEFCVSLKKTNCTNFEGIVKHKRFGKLIPKATVTLTNLCTGEDVKVFTDKKGKYTFPCIECGCEYVVKGEKENFVASSIRKNTLGINCESGETIASEILLDNNAKVKPPAKKQLVIKFNGVTVEVGAIIELKNLYYDFNKYTIRRGADEELNHIAYLMKLYPNMVIELRSHTDSRASDRYNNDLSQNRAMAAVEYLLSQGISRGRMVAKGFGETKLKNRCSDGVDCSEEEHQRNRRTEVRILRLDKDNVEVKYLDNLPDVIDYSYLELTR